MLMNRPPAYRHPLKIMAPVIEILQQYFGPGQACGGESHKDMVINLPKSSDPLILTYFNNLLTISC